MASSTILFLATIALVSSTSAVSSSHGYAPQLRSQWGHRVGAEISPSSMGEGLRGSNLRLRGGIANMAA
eukprot:990347-Rhodomonas_salina.3